LVTWFAVKPLKNHPTQSKTIAKQKQLEIKSSYFLVLKSKINMWL